MCGSVDFHVWGFQVYKLAVLALSISILFLILLYTWDKDCRGNKDKAAT